MRDAKQSQWMDALLSAVAIAVLGVVLCIGMLAEERGRVQNRGVIPESAGLYDRVEYGGQTYIEKTGTSAVLLMGMDDASGVQTHRQADFLFLLAVDHGEGCVRSLLIDPDTIVESNGAKVRLSQTLDVRIESSVEAVESILPGVEIDLYAAFDLTAIGLANDELGGVPMTLSEDFSAHDPSMVPGAKLTLDAAQAAIYVRALLEEDGPTNIPRMRRQYDYMLSASKILRRKLAESESFTADFLNTLSPAMTSNADQDRWVYELSSCYGYSVQPAGILAGDYRSGSDGGIEFYPASDAGLRWVLEAFYHIET